MSEMDQFGRIGGYTQGTNGVRKSYQIYAAPMAISPLNRFLIGNFQKLLFSGVTAGAMKSCQIAPAPGFGRTSSGLARPYVTGLPNHRRSCQTDPAPTPKSLQILPKSGDRGDHRLGHHCYRHNPLFRDEVQPFAIRSTPAPVSA